MRLRFERLLILTPLLLGLLSGCGAGANDKLHLEQKTFSRRSFLPELKGRWIGSAICYGPHRDGQRPGGPSPSAIEIRQDLQLMLPHWNLLRIYGSSEIAETLLEEIKNEKLAMKVMLGAWIAPEADAANRQEIDAAIRLANAYPEIVLAVSVGNETQVSWSGHRSPLDRLIDYVRHVRSNVAVPVTVADDFNFWNKPESRALAGEIDFITMHAHPMWNGVQLEDASKWLREQAAAIEAMHSDLDIVIGETGWATSVHDEGEQSTLIKGQPGEAEQMHFRESVRAWTAAAKRTVFFFEAFDEKWKGGTHPDEVEKHWGLFRSDRTAKAAMARNHSPTEITSP